MKYLRGYIAAAVFAVVSWALIQFAKTHTVLLDMVYPYITRLIQNTLADWTASLDVCLWQLLVVLLGVLLLASIVAMIIMKWNFFQWLGWVLATVSLIFFLHTGLYGLNGYTGPLAEDIRLDTTEYTLTELARATAYYRDKANELAPQVPRAGGYPSFEELADMADDGYHTLTYDRFYSVFSGSSAPVKKLGWADLYTSMGITGITMGITGEAAVNPNTPEVSLPFTMCHELAHRRCIATERDANFAAFLACDANSQEIFQYSGYFMAFRYCYNALASVGTSTAKSEAQSIYAGICPEMQQDLADYQSFWNKNLDNSASNFADSVNDTYIKVSGDDAGIGSYGEVCDLLVSWYIQEIYLPEHQEEEVQFDPLDKNQVDVGR